MSLINKIKSFYSKISITIKASFWYAFSILLVKAINFLTMPLFTNILSVEEYGILNLFLSWESVLLIFTSLYLYYHVFINGIHKFNDDSNNFISTLQLITTICTLLIFGIYCMLYKFVTPILGLPFDLMLIMFIDLLFCPAFQFWAAKERYNFKYKNVVIVTISMCVMTFIANIISVSLFENKLYAKIISTVVINVLFCLFFYIKIIVKSKGLKFENIKKYSKYALKFNLPLIPLFLSAYILNLSDRIMINYFCGSYEAGLYSVAYSIATIMIFVNSALNQALPPWFYKKMDNKEYKAINNTSLLIIIFISIINTIMSLIAPEIILIFSNKNYLEGLYVVPPLVCSVLFIFITDYIANIEYYFSETKYAKWISIIPALVNLVLNYIFINKYGYVAAGFTTLVSYMLFAIIRCYFMKKVEVKHGLKNGIIKIMPIFIISTIFICINMLIMVLYDYTILRYCFFILICLTLLIIILIFYKKYKSKKILDGKL